MGNPWLNCPIEVCPTPDAINFAEAVVKEGAIFLLALIALNN
jgi:hypothetical protein